MELLQAFGLDYKLLLANLINFVLLLFILKKILYKPLIQFIQDRTKKIEEGLKHAEQAEKTLAEAKTHQDEVLTQARKEASEVIEAARTQAETQAQSLLEKAKAESVEVVEKAKRDISVEREQALQNAKQEIASLVMLTTEKVLREKLDATTDKALIEKNLKEL